MVENTNALDLYNNYNQWQNDQTLKATIETYGMQNECVNVWDSVKNTNDKFSFMDGKDPNQGDNYFEQLALLAQGEMLAKDSNEDGFLDVSEYILAELESLEKTNAALGWDVSPEEAAIIAANSEMLFSIIDNKISKDGDGKLSIDELAQYNFLMDKASKEGFTGEKDGELSATYSSAATESLIYGFFDEESINEITQKYYDFFTQETTEAQS